MITLQWNAKGQQNKIMSNIHHSKANETYWIAFDIDFPFGNFGFEGTSYHNHLSFLNGYAENVFNPNDLKLITAIIVIIALASNNGIFKFKNKKIKREGRESAEN